MSPNVVHQLGTIDTAKYAFPDHGQAGGLESDAWRYKPWWRTG
jgi:hypothetical protein